MLSVMERLPEDSISENRKRLEEFIQSKTKKTKRVPLRKEKAIVAGNDNG